jgi:hypothetical protein
VRLFSAVPLDEAEYLSQSTSTIDEVRKFALEGKSKAIHALYASRSIGGKTFLEARITTDDGKSHVRRVDATADFETTERSLRKVLPIQIA